ncbi:MAG: hypothetical protein NTU54_01080 [Candidatus Omnitrophica bacterium]|nr:hypothetical protein [Candidatus Omnitrophota bacterium]
MKNRFYFFIGLIFVLGVNLYLRTFTINFPQLKGPARQTVEENIRNSAIKATEKTYPDFSALTRDRLVEVFISQYKKDHQKEIKKKIQDEYAKLKSRYQDSRGQTYLMELDCWNWARYTQNVLLLGHPGDKLAGGYNLDTLMLAPSGSFLVWNHFLFRSSALLYRIFSLFAVIPLFTFLFYLPLVYAVIFFVLLYCVIFKYWGNLAAVITCLYVGFAPDFLLHSSAGWFDMDVLNLLLPLLAVWAYAKSADTKANKPKLAWIIFSAFWVGLFSFTWPGWWFIFALIAGYEVFSSVNVACAYFQYKEKPVVTFKAHLIYLSIFALSACFWVIVLSGYDPLNSLYPLIMNVVTLNKGLTGSVWPNVYITVSEIGKISLEGITEASGNTFLFFVALLFLLHLFLRTIKERKIAGFRRTFTIMLVFWFIGMFFACFSGRRFTAFLHLPMGCSLGIGVSQACAYFKKKGKNVIGYLILGAVLILGAQDFFNAYARAKTIFPLMNTDWYKVLTQIKEKTPVEGVINSWWDYGDWFKAVANRKVIFDGQSQNTPQAYWMADVLLSKNEEEAVKTLAMLNNGGNRAYEVINEGLKDPLRSALLLKKILGLKPEAARAALLSALPAPNAEKVMHLVFDKPPKAYFIVDNTMCDKLGSISYIGSWDFVKAYLAKKSEGPGLDAAKGYLAKIKAQDKEEIERFSREAVLADPDDLEEIVSERFKIHSRLLKGQETDGLVLFDKGFVFRPKEQRIYLYSPRLDRFRIPKSLFLFENNQLREVVYPNNELDLSLLVFKDKNEYRAVLLERPLADSLFVRLYFLNAAGLKHFKPFIEEKVAPDSFIRVFEIVWE